MCICMADRQSVLAAHLFSNAAITSCWQSILDVFTPWIGMLQSSEGTVSRSGPLPPCLDGEIGLLETVVALFVNCVSRAQTHLRGM